MDDGSADEGTAAPASELDKTSLRGAIEVFDKTFMKDLWHTIRYVHHTRLLLISY